MQENNREIETRAAKPFFFLSLSLSLSLFFLQTDETNADDYKNFSRLIHRVSLRFYHSGSRGRLARLERGEAKRKSRGARDHYAVRK